MLECAREFFWAKPSTVGFETVPAANKESTVGFEVSGFRARARDVREDGFSRAPGTPPDGRARPADSRLPAPPAQLRGDNQCPPRL